jgi:hypothetical protein
LRDHRLWTDILVAKDTLLKSDRLDLDSGKDFIAPSWTVLHNHKRQDPRFTIPAKDRNPLVKGREPLVQVWSGEPTRQNTSVLGRSDSIAIICEKVQEQIARAAGGSGQSVTTSELARYIGQSCSAEAVRKLLNRINNGCFVSEAAAARVSHAIGLTVCDITFASPILYQIGGRERTSKIAMEVWAEQWINNEKYVYELLSRSRFSTAVYFQIFSEKIQEETQRRIYGLRFDIYRQIRLFGKLFRDELVSRFEKISEELRRIGFGAWVSYMAGSKHGEPEGTAKLFITIDRDSAIHRSVRVKNAIPFFPAAHSGL